MKPSRLLNLTLQRQNTGCPPIWLMRQAGRYHSHYQELRKKHSFMDLCKKPELACEVTLGPILDFDFDAAILFSDLLFPLEAMGMGLDYPEGGPRLDWHLRGREDLRRLKAGSVGCLQFQGEALEQIRGRLAPEKSLLGFVGGPFTLFCYAVEGSHQGSLLSSKQGIEDGRYEGFFEKLQDLLVQNMILQARAGADAVAVMDTCAGELDPWTYRHRVVPSLGRVLSEFHQACPETAVVYYSKTTGPDHWRSLADLPITGLGIDWRQDLSQVIREWGSRWAIQGNVDPSWLFLEPRVLEARLDAVFQGLRSSERQGWICGLGHGVLPGTPESNVRLFVKKVRETFR